MVAVKGWFYTHLQRQSVPTHGFLRKWQDPKPPEKYALFSERSAHVSAPVAPVFNLTILTGNKVPKYEYRDTQKTTMPHQLCLITVFWPVMSPCSLISCAIREHSTSINNIISTCRMYTFIGRHYVILFVISFWGFGFCINFVKSTSCGLTSPFLYLSSVLLPVTWKMRSEAQFLKCISKREKFYGRVGMHRCIICKRFFETCDLTGMTHTEKMCSFCIHNFN